MQDLSAIAQIDRLLNEDPITRYIPLLSRPVVTTLVRRQVDQYRQQLKQQNTQVDNSVLFQQITDSLEYYRKQRLQRVINATGILVHTNFGRSPMPTEVWREAEQAICHYSNLEQDLTRGKRGNRMGLLPQLIQALCGGDASLLVNNNAAAMHLIMRALGPQKEVIVSRGEQIQIGGGFRIPDILADSGAILRDVGTTNCTTVDDYLAAINDNTAMVLVVHTSNYYIEGFSQQADIRELARRLPPHILLVVDQGSGNLHNWLPGEPPVQRYIKAGAHLVCFSADKMLGGPQGGIIIGKAELINRLAKHPMMRAFRPGKETYALLESLLIHRLNQDAAGEDRVAAIVAQPESWHRERAERLAATAPALTKVVPASYLIGGGTTPRKQFDTWAVALDNRISANTWLEHLREHSPAIIGVTQQDETLLFPVTLLDDDFAPVEAFLRQQTKTIP